MTVPHGFPPLGILNGTVLTLKGSNDAGFQLAQERGGQGKVVRLAPAKELQSLLFFFLFFPQCTSFFFFFSSLLIFSLQHNFIGRNTKIKNSVPSPTFLCSFQ